MIKAIIFDFGNVVCEFDNNIFLRKISEFTDKSTSELNQLIYLSSDLPKRYETGLISSDQFFNEISKRCNLSMPKSEFIKAYTDIFTPIKTSFELIRNLKSQYKLALLSDTSEWDFEYGIRLVEVFDLFDAVTLSFEVKALKPDKKIFYDVLAKLSVEPEECIYIDDIEEYVRVARRIGIHAIHYTSHTDLCHSLRKLSVFF
jgi:putative hydrolase of the HAD superfamily